MRWFLIITNWLEEAADEVNSRIVLIAKDLCLQGTKARSYSIVVMSSNG